MDRLEFGAVVERHRRELQVHCYRMLGSVEDSEDVVQETFLRAWRGREGYEGRATLRAWLYKIATNACLDALKGRSRRVLPVDVAPAADPAAGIPEAGEHAWLEPYPDHLLEDGPDEAVVGRETIEIAFLAAMQHLPPRQRAVLILRDVVGWSAGETAGVLDLSVAAVKSALQRARATMRKLLPRRRCDWAPAADPTAGERALLARWVAALEAADTGVLAQLLRVDARVSFPPTPVWYDGREAFLDASRRHAAAGEYRAIPTSASLQPAVALYLRRPGDTRFRALALEVLRIEDGRVAEIVDFGDVSLFAKFGLTDSFSDEPSSQET
jgi:RNA polymerase sigma-70 factor (ECF subfamily)